MEYLSKIRNFCIIAHIDHGKSTLADKLLLKTGAVDPRKFRDQMLDMIDIERERGITIKAKAVRLKYRYDGEDYILNLIDTPGHVDFSYEVSRSLKACEGALLVVDASQGVEAQTVSHAYLAVENDLEIVPVVNKIDLPSADPEKTKREIEEIVGIPADDALLVSAKEGIGIDDVLRAIVERIPPPKGDPKAPLKALIFDAVYDPYKGVIVFVRVFDGTIRKSDRIMLASTKAVHEVTEVGVFTPEMVPTGELKAGEVGYIAANIKSVSEARVGDTLLDPERPVDPLPGFRPAKPMVFAGLYPVNPDDFDKLRDALEKLKLNDAALTFAMESSAALGVGFRVGFLGLLHMEVVQERLEREFGLELVATAPSVVHRVYTTDGQLLEIDNPAKLPPEPRIDRIEEPFVHLEVIVPHEAVGTVMKLLRERRAEMRSMEYLSPQRVKMLYEAPLSEIIFDFFDKLKSVTRGYGSMDYEPAGYRPSDLVKLQILINGDPVDALSFIVHRSRAYEVGRKLVDKLREVVPRQLFDVAIQAAIGRKVIARATVKAWGKNVLQKCYGGDVTRKRKLLEKQREGKKRLKQVGKVHLPQEAFLAVLKVGKEE